MNSELLEQIFLNFLNANGEKSETQTYFLPSEIKKGDLSFTDDDGRHIDLLSIQRTFRMGEVETPMPIFFGIVVDEDGEDTTDEPYFEFEELPRNVCESLLKVAMGMYKSDNEVWYWYNSKNGSERTECDNGYDTKEECYVSMRDEVFDYIKRKNITDARVTFDGDAITIIDDNAHVTYEYTMDSHSKYCHIDIRLSTDIKDAFVDWLSDELRDKWDDGSESVLFDVKD